MRSPAVSMGGGRRHDLLRRLEAAGVRRPVFEYEKAHTYPASQPFFERLDPSVALSALPGLPGPFWVYLHIPFCNYFCSFCFYKKVLSARLDSLFPMFLQTLERELAELRSRRNGQGIEAHDVYIGGGTPTALEPGQLEAVLDLLDSAVQPSTDFLGTCEASPESVTPEKAGLLLSRGLNRISLGAQSMDQATLDAMGRAHQVQQTADAFELLRQAGYSHINVDLIYGFPGQTPEQWRRELRSAMSVMNPESFTLYYLRYVPGTSLARQASAADRVAWDDLIAMREIYFDILLEAGYEMCRPHFFRQPVERVRRYRGAPTLDHGNFGSQIGLGPSAYSHLGDWVSRNAWPMTRWLDRVAEHGFGTIEGRVLTEADRHTRTVVKSLVGDLGLDRRLFEEETGQDLERVYGERLERLVRLELLRRTTTGYALTELGILLDEEVSYFLYPAGFQERDGT